LEQREWREIWRTHTQPFLSLLGDTDGPGNFSFHWQTFPDADKNRKDLIYCGYSTFRDICWDLAKLNEQGAGIFISVNETDGKGRALENIMGVRGFWADVETEIALEDLSLPPSMVVNSSRGPHLYWLSVGDATKELCRRIVQNIAARIGSDPKVHDPSRVLRVPGFFHNKGTPHLVTLGECQNIRYSVNQMLEAFPDQPKETCVARVEYLPPNHSPDAEEKVKRATAYIETIPGGIQPGRDNQLYVLTARMIRGFDLTDGEAIPLLEGWAARCTPSMDPREAQIQTKINNVRKHGTETYGSMLGDRIKQAPRHVQSEPVYQSVSEPPREVEELFAEYPDAQNMVGLELLLESGEPFLPENLRMRAVKFGLPKIDKALITCPTHVGVMAAETGWGKSSLVTQGMWESAKGGNRPLLISLEMIDEEIKARAASHVIGVNFQEILEKGTKAYMPERQIKLLNEMFFLCPHSGLPWEALEHKVKKAVKQYGIKSVWVDYFTLMQPPMVKREISSSASMYAEMSKSFKRLNQDLETSGVLVTQFNRTFKPGEKPNLFMLKETSQLEQDASWGLVGWLDEEENAHLAIDKNRGGLKLQVEIKMDLGNQRMEERSEGLIGLSSISDGRMKASGDL
jgi:KaiC/GvpD/RAD55 family RecA-like ATPase